MRKYWIYTGKEGEALKAIFDASRKPVETMRRVIVGKPAKAPEKPGTEKIERVTGEVEKAPKKPGSRKKDYYISVFKHGIGQTTEKITGNIMLIDGMAFGMSRPNPKSYYRITDLLTGFSVGECRTQKDIFETLTPELLQIIKEKHQSKDLKPYIQRISEAYNSEELPFC